MCAPSRRCRADTTLDAFYTITTDTATNNTTPRESLMDKVYYINAEINYKRTEFGLPLHQTEDTTKEE